MLTLLGVKGLNLYFTCMGASLSINNILRSNVRSRKKQKQSFFFRSRQKNN